MATPQDVIERAKALIKHDHMDDDEIFVHLQNRYEMEYETGPWSRRLRDFTISLVAQVASTSSDTVTVTNGLATISSAGTPFTSAMTGRAIQIGAEPQYFFFTFSTSATGSLTDGEGNAVTWPRATDTAASWRIFQTLYTLPSDCASVVSLGSDVEIDELDGGRARLDMADPHRESTDSLPRFWFYAGVNSSNVREIEVWPVPTSAILLRGQYRREAPTLTLTSTLELPTPLLVYSTVSDCYGALFSATGEPVWQRQQLFYEQKYKEAQRQYEPLEYERTSPPATLRRSHGRRLGADFYVNHQPLSEFPGR